MNGTSTPTAVRSPCVKVCEMDEAIGLCKGCFRTQDERDWWVAYTDDQQREVLRRCEQRRVAVSQGNGAPLPPSMGQMRDKSFRFRE